jgi:hypothetical protein
MFVEIRYRYTPIIAGEYVPQVTFSEIASMTVRDRRDLSQIYNAEAVTPSNCA